MGEFEEEGLTNGASQIKEYRGKIGEYGGKGFVKGMGQNKGGMGRSSASLSKEGADKRD